MTVTPTKKFVAVSIEKLLEYNTANGLVIWLIVNKINNKSKMGVKVTNTNI